MEEDNDNDDDYTYYEGHLHCSFVYVILDTVAHHTEYTFVYKFYIPSSLGACIFSAVEI
jgi:hypothetical protein